MSGNLSELDTRPRRSFAEPEEDGSPDVEKRRRNSFNKLQTTLGNEAQDAAEVVVAQMHMKNTDGTPAHNNSIKTMEKTGTAFPEKDSGGCCIVS